MQLRRLSLRNLRSYTDATLELGPGTTLVAGDVGSGKTSLLYAIEMALFGFAEVDDAAHLVRHQAGEAEVSLTLAGDDRSYELRRKFVRRHRKGRELFEATENSFARDGHRTQYSATELRQRAIELLGFPDNPNPRSHSDLWRWAVYIPQERMREVLDLDPEKRLETVRKALGLEQFRTAADNAQDVAAELRKRGEIKSAEAERLTHWSDEVAGLTDRLAAGARALEEARGLAVERRAALDQMEREIAGVQGARRQVEADQREADEIAAQRLLLERAVGERTRREADRRGMVAALRADAAAARARSAQEARWRSVVERSSAESIRVRAELDATRDAATAFAGAGSRMEQIDRAVHEYEQAQVEAGGEAAAARHELETLAHEGPQREPTPPTAESVAELEGKVRAEQEELDRLRGETARAEHELEEISSLVGAGVCPRCHQAVSAVEFTQHATEATRDVARLRERVGSVLESRGRWDEARRSRERFDRTHDRWQQVERRRETARSVVTSADRRAQELAGRLAGLLGERSDLQARIAELEPAGARSDELRGQLRTLESEVGEAQRKAEEAGRRAERAAAADGQAALVEEELQRLDREAAEAAERDLTLRRRREALAPRLSEGARLADQERAVATGRDAARGHLDRSLGDLARLEQQLEEGSRRLREAEEGAGDRARLLGEVVHLRKLGAWFSGPFREGALRLERQMLGQAHREFERSFARYFGTLIEDPSLVARLDQHFSPYVEVDGEWTPPPALSGGERTALALAYRLALGGVVRSAGRLQLTTLILDEPTDGFSPEQVARMGELLDELGLPQVILVSHEAGLSAVADRVVRVRKAGGVSMLEGDAGPGIPPMASAPVEDPRPRRRASRAMRLDDPPPAGGLT